MGFKKLRIAPINSWVSQDGYPVYASFVKLQNIDAANELNSIDIKFNNVTKERTYNADDKEEKKKVVMRVEGVLKVYDVDVAVARSMFGHGADANGNTIEYVNNTADKKRYGMFFEGKTSQDVRYQKYIYDVEFDEPEFITATDTGEDATTMEITFVVRFITKSNGKVAKCATVYYGNTGWILEEPQTMYKEVEAVAGLIPLNAPIISADEDNIISWSAIPNAANYVVVVNGIARAPQSQLIFAAITEPGAYSIHVVAKGDGVTYADSANSNVIVYTID